ncbi:MAG: 23S rRNA (uracil(1939)-C(5))-methyltransferase RlmD [Acidobacteriota bacterium]
MDIILASRSPRRRELMARVAPEFRVFPVDVDEAAVRQKDPVKFAIEAAVLKAKAAAGAFPEAIVIGADTVVSLEHRILGKPDDRASARAMLELLSGRRHRVITGLAFYRRSEDRLLTGYELTYVTFHPLSDGMIEAYLDQEDYLDKAGAYAVQDVGDAFVRRLKGEFDNVVGFPVKKAAAMLARFQAPAFSLDIEDMDFPQNAGIGRRDGRTIFVPGAVAGDAAVVQAVGENRGGIVAEIIRLEKPSAARVEPRCPHFGVCGGCLFQNVSYARQLEFKRRHLARVLNEALPPGHETILVPPVVPSPDIYHYRNKMEFAFSGTWGELVVGLRERGDPRRKSRGLTIGLGACQIFSPAAGEVFPAVLEFAREKGLAPHNPRTGQGSLRHMVLREGKRTGELMVLLVTAPGPETDFEPLVRRLAAALGPRLKSFWHVANGRNSDIVSFEETRLLCGAPAIHERLAGLSFRIGPSTFFQTNTAAAELLYAKIGETAGLDATSRVLGLYCGSGAIELSLANRVKAVTGIDSLPENVLAAEENAAANGVTNAAFLTGTIEDLLKSRPVEAPDVLILDPPRPGLTPKALMNIMALEAPKIAYVSCNPAALARNLRYFLGRRYRCAAVVPFDFFPHTPHLETLAMLARRQ